MTVSERFDYIVEMARTAEPDQTKRIDNNSMLIGYIVLSLSQADVTNENLIAIAKFMIMNDMDSLDSFNHTFVVP